MSLRANLTLLFICAALPAQVTEKFTNTDVVNMIKAGLPEGTVILAIKRAVYHGDNDFDGSPQGLIALKNAGATKPILNFILTAPTVHRYEPSTIVPGLPVPHGVYFQSTAGWSPLDSVILLPNVRARSKANWKVLASWDYGREDRRYLVPGRQARARLAGARPVLYLRGQHPGREWSMVRLTPQTDDRELITTIPDVFATLPRIKFASGAPVGLESTLTAEDVVTLRPTADLTPGQYLVFRFVSDQTWVIEGYAFELGTI
jgi:hypothetical protein